MPLNRVWIPSPNFSSRSGEPVRLIVLHTAEGARTIESLGGFFKGPVQASSHCGADDKENTVGQFVRRANKAWAVAAYNSASVSLELCAFASWPTSEWMDHQNMLHNCAKWIAEESRMLGIPITRLSAGEAQGSGRGVCQHVDLGLAGGGHHDCGPGFPMEHVLELARGHKSTPTHHSSTPHPTFPGTLLRNPTSGHGAAVWQDRMKHRGWSINTDGHYGAQSEKVCRQFQSEKGLAVDGIVGSRTWNAAWTEDIT